MPAQRSCFLQEQADGYILAGPLPPLAIPSTLRDSLVARLDRLAPVKEVAQIGATIGREFGYELLAAVSRFSDNELKDALAHGHPFSSRGDAVAEGAQGVQFRLVGIPPLPFLGTPARASIFSAAAGTHVLGQPQASNPCCDPYR